MFPFSRPTSYGEMLDKIGAFTFLLALGLTWVVGHYVPSIDKLLSTRQTTVEVLTIKIPLLYVLPAVIIAVLARIFRLHDKVSDLFGLRARFDVKRILVPLCESLQIPVDVTLRNKLKENRASIMQRTYYEFASFEEPKISKALVLGAIDRWTWYWILLEFCVLLILTAAAFFVLGAYAAGVVMLLVFLLAVLIFSTYDSVCGRLAGQQIDEILADKERANHIKQQLAQL